MNQAEFITAVEVEIGTTDVSKTTIKKVLDAASAVGLEILKEQNALAIPLFGLGKIKIVKRKERKARNPRTGEVMQVPARNAVKYVPSSLVKSNIN